MSENLRTGTIQVRMRGPWFIGGHTPPAAGRDAATAQRGQKGPYVPASALKGALREAVALHLRSIGETCCDPWTPWETRQSTCAVTPCRVCRIFGTPGPDRPGVMEAGQGQGGAGWGTQGLRLEDALPVAEPPVPLGDRYGVAIDRVTRRAAEARLYQRQVADPDGPVLLSAPFRARMSEEDLDYLARSAHLIERMGNSRTRGLGEVEVRIERGPIASGPAIQRPKSLGSRALIRVTTVEAIHLGKPPSPDRGRGTSTQVPGSALHGALYAASLRAEGVTDPNQESDSKHLAETLRLSDLWATDSTGALPCPPHRALLRCQDCERHVDRSIHEAVALALLRKNPDKAWAVMPSAECADGQCRSQRLKRSGVIHHGQEVRRQLITRLALDPASQSAAPNMRHSREQIAPGTRFVGTVDALDARTLAALDRVAAKGEPVLLGGLRNRGLGTIQVELLPPTSDLAARIQFYQKSAQRYAAHLSELGWRPDRLILVVARTPIHLPHPEHAPQEIGDALFGAGHYTHHTIWQRLIPRSGWDDRAGKPRPVVDVIEPGSCWLYETTQAPNLAALQDAESRGLGLQTELGLGRVMLCPPIPESKPSKPKETSMAPSIRAQMAQRAVALYQEGKLRNALTNAQSQVTRTALKNLAQAAQEAEVSEEMEIVLKYQSARGHLPPEAAAILLAELAALKTQPEPVKAFSYLMSHVVRLQRSLETKP